METSTSQKLAEKYTSIIIFGGRNYHDLGTAFSTLDKLRPKFHPYAIFGSGGASGADALGEEWAYDRQYDFIRMPIKSWEWDKYGKAAGRKRNERLFRLMKPNYGVMFPGGNGTAHMKSLFDAEKIPVFEAV